MTRDEWDELSEREQEHAFTVSGVQQAELVTDTWKAIDKAIEDGETFEDFQDRIGDELFEAWGTPDAPRLQTVFRTAVNQAYNDGREEQFTNPAVLEARPYWRFEQIDDADLCEICEACGGVIASADDPFWENRPPLHPNCRCSFSALSSEEAIEEGLDLAGTSPPDISPSGFGTEDYEPDVGRFPDEIGDELGDVLEQS
jgi:SPP1 gp7 family putative phage head morphogenesis protein